MQELLKRFALEGEIKSTSPLGNGHINKTFLVETDKKKYVFQFVNASIFPDVEGLMNNIYLVTEHLKEKGVPTMEIVKTKDGKLFVQDGDQFFRGYSYVENSVCYEALPTLDLVSEAAKGFGAFHEALLDMDMKKIVDVIPFFHDTRKRYQDFLKAKDNAKKELLDSCLEEVNYLLSRECDYGLLADALDKGIIHTSITHNDPKINNVAFDKDTGKVACILDLDTVMTGTFLYDFGDGLRSLFTGDNEDSLDLSKLVVDFDIYKAYVDGYYKAMKPRINEVEISLLPDSIRVIALELAMRFLGDYLNGSVYFHVDYPTHNLVRARTQIALAKDLLKNDAKLREITAEIVKKYS